jgi:formylglycine-generating enzyme required for sulfatase activity
MARKETERKSEDARRWYVNGQGQTMVIVPAGATFWMGSPGSEPDRWHEETLHRVHIPRAFALATREVTVAQFLAFRPDYQYVVKYSPRPDGPILFVTWYEAAEYCNWLSAKEGLPKEEWCFLPNPAGKYGPGMRLAPGYLNKKGYRLPTEAEWEYACRAGAVTTRFYGHAEELLGEYAWYSKNTKSESARPGGLLKPNDLGLFDLYGNAVEWTIDPATFSKRPGKGNSRDDKETFTDIETIKDEVNRFLCGGSFENLAIYVRTSHRFAYRPSNDYYTFGLRVARTHP